MSDTIDIDTTSTTTRARGRGRAKKDDATTTAASSTATASISASASSTSSSRSTRTARTRSKSRSRSDTPAAPAAVISADEHTYNNHSHHNADFVLPASVGVYIQFCELYKVVPNGGILTGLRLQTNTLRPSHPATFQVNDLLAIVDTILACLDDSRILSQAFDVHRIVGHLRHASTMTMIPQTQFRLQQHGHGLGLQDSDSNSEYNSDADDIHNTMNFNTDNTVNTQEQQLHEALLAQQIQVKLQSQSQYIYHFHKIDLRYTKIGSHGIDILCKLIHHVKVAPYIHYINLDCVKLGKHGAKAIAHLFSTAMYTQQQFPMALKTLILRSASLGEEGGLIIAKWLMKQTTNTDFPIHLLDLSNNMTGSHVTIDLEYAVAGINQARKKHNQNLLLSCEPSQVSNVTTSVNQAVPVICDIQHKMIPEFVLEYQGNHLLPEIMNSVSHGLGVLVFGLFGVSTMLKYAGQQSMTHFISCSIYCTTLLVLYLSSTLYHSFFALRTTRAIFGVLDHSAIYLLIAGSYTPFLTIVLPDDSWVAKAMLIYIWVAAVVGIWMSAFATHASWYVYASLATYVSMGWICILALPQIIAGLGDAGFMWLLSGGLFYTGGIPFFIYDRHYSHALWHLFVLTGSVCHYICILWYVVPLPLVKSSGQFN